MVRTEGVQTDRAGRSTMLPWDGPEEIVLARYGECYHLDAHCPGLNAVRHGIMTKRKCSLCGTR